MLLPTPTLPDCYSSQQVPFEPVMREGVALLKQCAGGCTLIKLVESAQGYFVESSCPSGSNDFGGFGNTYLVCH